MRNIKTFISFPIILTLAMIMFVVLEVCVPFGFIILGLIFIVPAVVFLLIGLIFKKKYPVVFFLLLSLFLIAFIGRMHRIKTVYNESRDIIEHNEMIIGRVGSYPYVKKGKLEFELTVFGAKQVMMSDYLKVTPFKVLLKIKDYGGFSLKRGDILNIDKKIALPVERVSTFNYRRYLYHKKVYGVITITPEQIHSINHKLRSSLMVTIFQKTLWRTRRWMIRLLNKGLDRTVCGFIMSIFFGIRSSLDSEIIETFRSSGMVHILAISGLHVGFFGITFYKLFKRFLSRSKALVFSNVLLLLFILIIMPSASSYRAFFMYLTASIFFITGINAGGLTSLSISAIILLFINPYYIFDLGFQFSFLATAGILITASFFSRLIIIPIPRKVKASIAVTLAAFSSITGLQWALFNKVPLFSLVSSIVIVPLFGLVFAALFVLVAVFLCLKSGFIIILIEGITFMFLWIIKLLSKIPVVYLPDIPAVAAYVSLPLMIIIIYIIIPGIPLLIRKRRLWKLVKKMKPDGI